MFRKGVEALLGASFLVSVLAGCFGGGGGGSDSGAASVSMTLVDPSNPAPSAFRFSLGQVALISDSDEEFTLFPPAADPLASARIEHHAFGGVEFYIGELSIPSGSYRAIRFRYDGAEAGLSEDPRPVVPSFADLQVPFADRLELADGEHRNVRLVFDLEHSLSSAGGAFLIDPLTFAHVDQNGQEAELSEFLGRVASVDAAHHSVTLALLHSEDTRPGLAEYGEVDVFFQPGAVVVTADNQPLITDAQQSQIPAFLGPQPLNQWLEVHGFLQADGSIRVQTAEVRPNDTHSSLVQVEGVVGAVETSAGVSRVDLDVTSIEADGNGTVHPSSRRLSFYFSSDSAPPAFIGWTGTPFAFAELTSGVGVQIEGFEFSLPPGTSGSFVGQPPHDDSGPNPAVFTLTNMEVSPVALTGTVHAITPNAITHFIVQVDRIAGQASASYPTHVAVSLPSGAQVRTDGLLPASTAAIRVGEDVQINGHFAERVTIGTAGGGLGFIDDTPQSPGGDGRNLPHLAAISVSLRGAEFEGETVSAIDPLGSRFVLTGDGSDFGFPDPTSLLVEIRQDSRIVMESTGGRQVGASVPEFFADLPFAHQVSLRGLVDRSANPPVFVASWVRVELP